MDPFSISAELYSLLFAAGLVAGFVDSIAGGGGLISLPVLVSMGLPPQVALGTNKLQGSFGSFSAALNYISKGKTPLKSLSAGIAFTFIGAVLGAWAIQQLDPSFLTHLIPVLLLVVLIYTLWSKNLGRAPKRPLLRPLPFYVLFGTCLGFYDGFFGPGTGSFWTAAFLVFMGLEMTTAVGFTKVMNFTSNIVALGVFVVGGHVLYPVGLCMAAGQAVGARLGSSLAIHKGASFIRPFFMIIVAATMSRMVYVTYLR